jgi:hypothetical protein
MPSKLKPLDQLRTNSLFSAICATKGTSQPSPQLGRASSLGIARRQIFCWLQSLLNQFSQLLRVKQHPTLPD